MHAIAHTHIHMHEHIYIQMYIQIIQTLNVQNNTFLIFLFCFLFSLKNFVQYILTTFPLPTLPRSYPPNFMLSLVLSLSLSLSLTKLKFKNKQKHANNNRTKNMKERSKRPIRQKRKQQKIHFVFANYS